MLSILPCMPASNGTQQSSSSPHASSVSASGQHCHNDLHATSCLGAENKNGNRNRDGNKDKDKDEDKNNNREYDEEEEDCSHGPKQCKMHHIKHTVVRMSADLASCKYVSKSCYM